MKTVIIDDESNGRKTLGNFIHKYANYLEIVGEADGIETGVILIDEKKPDLVFLDIQMPGGTGFDVLRLAEWNQFKIIFVTAYDQYAVKAFRFSAFDYLLKPLDPQVFMSTIQKLLKQQGFMNSRQREIMETPLHKMKRIALHSEGSIHYIELANVIRCESDGNYTHFHVSNKKTLIVSKTLKEFDEVLSEKGFVRIHKSHLVNREHVRTYLKNDGGWIEMSDGVRVEVSRRRKEHLLQVLAQP